MDEIYEFTSRAEEKFFRQHGQLPRDVMSRYRAIADLREQLNHPEDYILSPPFDESELPPELRVAGN